jgi:hypothetical protein
VRLSSSWTRVLGCTTAGAFGFGVIVGVVPAIDDDEAARFVEDGATSESSRCPPYPRIFLGVGPRSHRCLRSLRSWTASAVSPHLRQTGPPRRHQSPVGSGSIRSSKDTDRVVTESDVGACEGSKTRAVGPCVAGDVPLPVSSWEETMASRRQLLLSRLQALNASTTRTQVNDNYPVTQDASLSSSKLAPAFGLLRLQAIDFCAPGLARLDMGRIGNSSQRQLSGHARCLVVLQQIGHCLLPR